MLFRLFPLLAGLIGLVILLSPEQAAAVGPPGILEGLGPFFWLSLGVSFLIACYLLPLIIVFFSTLLGGGLPSFFLDKETKELFARCDAILAKWNESSAESETFLSLEARRALPPIPMPAFARNLPSDKTERKKVYSFFSDQLYDQLAKRPELEMALAGVTLHSPQEIPAACAHWSDDVCARGDIYAAALMAAAARLRPQGLPDDEANFWESRLIALLGEGEACNLIGLSSLLLYIHLQPDNAEVSLNAWRQAVVYFRRSGLAGHLSGMQSAKFLASTGHDVPFAPPDGAFRQLMPPLEKPDDSFTEVFFWSLRLAEAGCPASMYNLGRMSYSEEPSALLQSERWFRMAMENGVEFAAEELGHLYLEGTLPDETGKKAAICLIVLACMRRWLKDPLAFVDKGVELSDADMKQLENDSRLQGAIGQRVRSQIAACKAEGEALYREGSRRFAEWPPESESAKRLTEEIRSKLPELRKAAKARRKKQPLRKSMDRAPASPREKTARDRPRRSFARPDKR